MWMLPGDFRDFSRSLVAVMVFVSNVLFWQETGYFGAAAELKPLLHTWSLAVEEQFYILFPMLLLLVRRVGKPTTVILIVSCTIASLTLAEWASQTHPQANFFLLPTRAWELGIGAVVSIANPGLGRATQMMSQVGSISGLGMIVYAVFVFSDSVPFPGFWALLPVLGTALVIVYASPRTVVGRLLAHPTLLRIGLMSYSAYLWHQPLFAFARIRSIGEPPLLVYLFLIAVTFCLAYLSWRFVEQPFRNSANLTRTQVFVSAVVGSVAIASFGLSGQMLSGIPNRFPSDVV
jgi:peptidoglycan/LPS O-acetylase OafA/YrhL